MLSNELVDVLGLVKSRRNTAEFAVTELLVERLVTLGHAVNR